MSLGCPPSCPICAGPEPSDEDLRIASLESALRAVLSVIDTRGFMTPEQQLVLARAREVLGK